MSAGITVWRLCVAERARQALTGEGAFRAAGRWNSPGIRIVYCAESRALAALEVLVHVEDLEALHVRDWRVIEISLPPDLIVSPKRYPPGWSQFPHSRAARAFGTRWAQSGLSAALKVPSAVVPGEFNYLINPAHPDFARLIASAPRPFRFDRRIRPS